MAGMAHAAYEALTTGAWASEVNAVCAEVEQAQSELAAFGVPASDPPLSAEFAPANVRTKEDRSRLVYTIVISLNNPDTALKSGMIADVLLK